MEGFLKESEAGRDCRVILHVLSLLIELEMFHFRAKDPCSTAFILVVLGIPKCPFGEGDCCVLLPNYLFERTLNSLSGKSRVLREVLCFGTESSIWKVCTGIFFLDMLLPTVILLWSRFFTI